MTDRELLELAARAIGDWSYEFRCFDKLPNPEDDGDAFRLAVALRIDIEFFTCSDGFVVKASARWFDGPAHASEPFKDDGRAATRLAVTRVATEIGRKM